MEPDDENTTYLQERVLVEMCSAVKQTYSCILTKDETALLDTVLSLNADSQKLLYSMCASSWIIDAVAGNGRRSFSASPPVGCLFMISRPFGVSSVCYRRQLKR